MMYSRFTLLFAAFALLLALSPAQASSPRTFTANSQVVDYANSLDKKSIEQMQQQLTNTEFVAGPHGVILAVPNLQGRGVENYARQIISSWGIGQRNSGGYLLLLARDEKEATIVTTGRQMGGLSRSTIDDIIRTSVLPMLQRGDVKEAALAGSARIAAALTGTGKNGFLPNMFAKHKDWAQVGVILFLIFMRVFFGFGRGFGRRRTLLGSVLEGVLGGSRRRW